MKYERQEPMSVRASLALVAFAVFLGLLAAPVKAATYGPPAPVVEAAQEIPDGYRIVPVETMEMAEARLTRDTNSAWRAFWIGQGMAAADIGLTCAVIARGGRELNPIYGKEAGCASSRRCVPVFPSCNTFSRGT